MIKDIKWKAYFSDDGRYADIINGIACSGIQAVSGDDLQELDSQNGFLHGPAFLRGKRSPHESGLMRKLKGGAGARRVKVRDMVRKAAFGMNFVVTFILYSGLEEWDGPESLHDMLDFTDIPAGLKGMVPDYRINLIEIRKLKDTSVFKTDVRQVFDFIRFSEDKEALTKLVESDDYYHNMEEDAFEVAAHYTNAQELIETKDYYSREDGKVDMCRAIKELIADGRAEGIAEGKTKGIHAVISICRELNVSDEAISKKLMENFQLTEDEAGKYLQ